MEPYDTTWEHVVYTVPRGPVLRGCNLWSVHVITEHILAIANLRRSCKIVLRWMSHYNTGVKTLPIQAYIWTKVDMQFLPWQRDDI